VVETRIRWRARAACPLIIALLLSAAAAAEMQIAPSRVVLGDLGSEDRAERIVVITAGEGTDFAITRARSDGKCFGVEFAAVKAGRMYRLTVRSLPPLPDGVLRETITVRTDSEWYPQLEIAVSARVNGPLEVIPGEITASTRHVTVRRRGGKPFVVKDVRTPEAGITSAVTPRGDGEYRIDLSAVPADLALNGQFLTIATDVPHIETIEVPFSITQADPAVIEYFYEPGCPECGRIKYEVLPDMAAQFPGRYVLRRYPLTEEVNARRLIAYQDRLKITKNTSVLLVIDYRRPLDDITTIVEWLPAIVEESLNERDSPDWTPPEPIPVPEAIETGKMARKRLREFTLGAVLILVIGGGCWPGAGSVWGARPSRRYRYRFSSKRPSRPGVFSQPFVVSDCHCHP